MNDSNINSSNLLTLKNAFKSYNEDHISYDILKDINLDLKRGEIIAVLGSSGSGKSTLLNILGLLDTLNKGSIIIDNINCTNLTEKYRTEVRKNKIGFVFQFHHLLVDFTVLENVMLPQLIKKESRMVAKKNALNLIDQVGLSSKINKYPNELSGGERQRVAIARALVNKPVLILADEPTGNLDSSLSVEIFNLILGLVKDNNSTAVIATHDLAIADMIDKKIFLKNGN